MEHDQPDAALTSCMAEALAVMAELDAADRPKRSGRPGPLAHDPITDRREELLARLELIAEALEELADGDTCSHDGVADADDLCHEIRTRCGVHATSGAAVGGRSDQPDDRWSSAA